MVLYLSIIFACMIIISLFNLLFGCDIYGFSPLYAWLGVVIGTLFMIVIDAIIATITVILPKSWFSPYRKIFTVFPKERAFYEKIKIRKWKDKVFASIGWDKRQVKDTNDNEYLFRFLTETCIAEFMHVISIFVGFLLIFVFPLEYIWCFGFPIALVNAFLQLLPVFIQRYNRPKLLKLYEYNKKIAERKNKSA